MIINNKAHYKFIWIVILIMIMVNLFSADAKAKDYAQCVENKSEKNFKVMWIDGNVVLRTTNVYLEYGGMSCYGWHARDTHKIGKNHKMTARLFLEEPNGNYDNHFCEFKPSPGERKVTKDESKRSIITGSKGNFQISNAGKKIC